ncbi:MAG: paraquat-inducible protein A [Candidatus Omnitrophica bacterium]|nr:paraquat-inducible protein A [Candidatus Omnitrophota bacterium]
MSGRRLALYQRYPRSTLVVLPTIILSAVFLFEGLSLPILYSKKLFWQTSYSVWTGIVSLWEQSELALATIVFFFSMVFPVIKLLALATLWFLKLREEQRSQLLRWLSVLGKWSMLDVFVVAILIVLVKLGPLVTIEPRIGIYFFAGAILCSMLTTMYVERIAKRVSRPR